MTPKHKERIENLLDALDDYQFQAEFPNNDFGRKEYNSILALQGSLKMRLATAVCDCGGQQDHPYSQWWG